MRSGLKDNNPTEGGSSSVPPPPWIDLPRDLTANILRRLGQVEILQTARKVCTTWRSVCSEPSFWRVIDLEYCSFEVVLRFSSHSLFGHEYFMKFERAYSQELSGLRYEDRERARRANEDLERDRFHNPLCRRAVDLSQGELIDINIEYFGTDGLLYYISQRSSHLKRLRLKCCNFIDFIALTASVKKFPDLEELHLEYMAFVNLKDIETISISCPKLKSFTFSITVSGPWQIRSSIVEIDDNYALRIAKNIPNLRYLCLSGVKLSKEGRKAFFDSCPNLDYFPM